MPKKLDKRFILTDNSVNRYGFRVLTSGLNLSNFKKNPVILWMHYRDEGSERLCDYKPIGHWEDIEVNDKDELSAVPVFDLTDELSENICSKVEAGTIRATSIGFRPITYSDDPKYLLPGQTRATVIKGDLMEASFCDIPANANAVRLYGDSIGLSFDTKTIDSIPLINNLKTMKLKETMLALLAFLGIAKEKAAETDLSEEQLTQINDEMSRLRNAVDNKTAEIDSLKSSHASVLASKDAEIKSLKDSLTQALADKDTEIKSLKDQIEALKKSPSDTPELTPKKEPIADDGTALDQLAAFAESHSYSETIAEGKRLGIM